MLGEPFNAMSQILNGCRLLLVVRFVLPELVEFELLESQQLLVILTSCHIQTFTKLKVYLQRQDTLQMILHLFHLLGETFG